MAIITFAQVKGGSGKTTAAMCTVAELVARKSSVAALDLDPNRPLGEFFARVSDLKHVEVAVPNSERRVTALVKELAKTYDNVVIDLMGAATNDTQVAMAVADLVIVPSQMSGTDFRCGVETWQKSATALSPVLSCWLEPVPALSARASKLSYASSTVGQGPT